jgi:hypothetical protein
MDDGHTYHKGLYLNTQSYSNEDINLLIKALEVNFNIKAKSIQVSGKPSQSGYAYITIIITCLTFLTLQEV